MWVWKTDGSCTKFVGGCRSAPKTTFRNSWMMGREYGYGLQDRKDAVPYGTANSDGVPKKIEQLFKFVVS